MVELQWLFQTRHCTSGHWTRGGGALAAPKTSFRPPLEKYGGATHRIVRDHGSALFSSNLIFTTSSLYSYLLAFQKFLNYRNWSSELRVMLEIRKGIATAPDTARGWRCPVRCTPKRAVPPSTMAASSFQVRLQLLTPDNQNLALFFSFSTPNSSKTTPTPSPLQMCQHHHVSTILCTCVSFSQTFYQRISHSIHHATRP
jgi:hypothetical protein